MALASSMPSVSSIDLTVGLAVVLAAVSKGTIKLIAWFRVVKVIPKSDFRARIDSGGIPEPEV